MSYVIASSASNQANERVMLQVVQAFDRKPFAEVPVDDAEAMETKLQAALRALGDRDGRLAPHARASVLRRAAGLLDGRRDHFARHFAREGGKPLTDATVEVSRAIDGLNCAADELRNFAGREIPMGFTAASSKRWASRRASRSASCSRSRHSIIRSI
jgi:acyl-CoA reductase-like NAD-dependent aldehyde dehydrogenase